LAGKMKKKSFAPKIESIKQIQEFVKNNLPENLLDLKKSANIELIIEELVINIINHGFEEEPSSMIDFGIDTRNHDIVIKIRDNGIAFNPLEKKDPDLAADIEERELGGLGIFFVKQLAKDIRYFRKHGKNNLYLII
jgi:anti-sigma regulatory factor (Ser/Thr protein kinase)